MSADPDEPTTYTFRRVPLDAEPSAASSHPNGDGSQRPHTLRAAETEWYAYIEGNPPSGWYNGQTYVDTLSKSAIRRFIEVTHERYKEAVGNEFGRVVPSIFCDEPQFSHKAQLLTGTSKKDLFFPWSDDLGETFSAEYGYDILDQLPSIVWNTPGALVGSTPPARYHYHEHVCERFVSAFMDQISSWCRSNRLALTGHMMQEPTLRSQTETLGEAMRCYRSLDVPGIDILHDAFELNTAKQAVSVSRQRNGASGRAMSELYGVTNWTFDWTGYKAQGDWQAAMGITLRVPHLSMYTLAGEGKRDYPASIGYQAPWALEWSGLEDHFARVNVALTRGRPVSRIAVVHPIESFWLAFGPLDTGAEEQIWRLEAHDQLTDWLCRGLVDFDFVAESLLAEWTDVDDIRPAQGFRVGQCVYDAVILPNLKTIRSTTLERVRRFAQNGGKVIITGPAPTLVDAVKPESALQISEAQYIHFNRFDVVQAVQHLRDIDVTEHWGTRAEDLLYQLREEEDGQRWLFLCNTDRKKSLDTVVNVRGTYSVEVMDTATGTSWALVAQVQDGCTSWSWVFEGAGSLLVRLVPRDAGTSDEQTRPQKLFAKEYGTLSSVLLDKVELCEPNVFLLDYAEWRLASEAQGQWHSSTEVLRLDNLARSLLDMPLRTEKYQQPWSISDTERAPRDTLCLRYAFKVDREVQGPVSLALEGRDNTVIRLDGKPVNRPSDGWWVDKSITTVPLVIGTAQLGSGVHTLELDISFGLLTNVERIYLLGEFGVDVRGSEARITGPLDLASVRFGDWTRQGLPFYAGSMVYHCTFDLPPKHPGHIAIEAPEYAGPLVTAALDGASDTKPLYLHPAYAYFGDVRPGTHSVVFTAYGNRENAFGTLHLPSGKTKWHGPNAWRYEHDWWCDEYNVKPMGLLQAPKVKVRGKEDVVQVRRSKVQKWYN